MVYSGWKPSVWYAIKINRLKVNVGIIVQLSKDLMDWLS